MLTTREHGHYLRYPEDVGRDFGTDELRQWCADTARKMAPAMLAALRAEYAKTPFNYVASFDAASADLEGLLEQALSDATFPAHKRMED